MFSKIKKFIKEVKYELTKVTWSSRKELVGSTIVVIVVSIIVALYIGIVDYGLTNLVHILLR